MMGKAATGPSEEAIADVKDKIATLPAVSALTVAHKEAVRAAETAYNNLGDSKSQIGVDLTDKINSCIAKVDFWDELAAKTVVDAASSSLNTDLNGWGTACTPGVDNNTFGKVMTVPAGATILAWDASKQDDAWKACSAIGFYIYNPTDTDVEGTYNMDVGGTGCFLLKANSWNYIELADVGTNASQKFITAGSTLYFHGNFVGEGWKVSSFYNESAIDVEDKTVVIDAENVGLSTDVGGWTTPCAAGADDDIFGKVMTVPAGATALAIEPGRQNDAWKASKSIVFYIFNPTGSDVAGTIGRDGGKIERAFLLRNNAWTRVEISDYDSFISANKTMYINAGFSGEGWKVSSFYAVPVPAAQEESVVLLDGIRGGFSIWNEVAKDATGATITADVTEDRHSPTYGIVYDEGTTASKIGFTPFDVNSAYVNAKLYDTIEFYIYNPGEDCAYVVQEGGPTNYNWLVNGTLTAGEWTKITVPASSSGEEKIMLYIYGTSGVQYKVSSFSAIGENQ